MKQNNDIHLKEISYKEMQDTNGGIIAEILAGAGLALACAYYAGYAYGRLTC